MWSLFKFTVITSFGLPWSCSTIRIHLIIWCSQNFSLRTSCLEHASIRSTEQLLHRMCRWHLIISRLYHAASVPDSSTEYNADSRVTWVYLRIWDSARSPLVRTWDACSHNVTQRIKQVQHPLPPTTTTEGPCYAMMTTIYMGFGHVDFAQNSTRSSLTFQGSFSSQGAPHGWHTLSPRLMGARMCVSPGRFLPNQSTRPHFHCLLFILL